MRTQAAFWGVSGAHTSCLTRQSKLVALLCAGCSLTNFAFCQGLAAVLGPRGSLFRADYPPTGSVSRQREQHLLAELQIDVSMHR